MLQSVPGGTRYGTHDSHFWLTIAVAFLAGVGVYRVCRWLGRPDIGKKYGVITGIVWFAMWLGPVGYAVLWMFNTERIGVYGLEADRILAHWKVPPGAASDVCYYRTARMSEFADFNISETDFLGWMKANAWTPRRYTFADEFESLQWDFQGEPETVGIDVWPVRSRNSDKPKSVLDGYCYHQRFVPRAEGFRTIIYDVKAKRAYILAPN